MLELLSILYTVVATLIVFVAFVFLTSIFAELGKREFPIRKEMLGVFVSVFLGVLILGTFSIQGESLDTKQAHAGLFVLATISGLGHVFYLYHRYRKKHRRV